MAENTKNTGPVPAATAPFNFIPYEPEAVLDDWPKERGHWSGRIVCQLKALKPLLVSGGQIKKDKEPAECRFATVDDKPVIPGTSIKGMLRNLVQILSFSAMRPVSSELLIKKGQPFKYSPCDLAFPDNPCSKAVAQGTLVKGGLMDFASRLFGSVAGEAFKGRVSVASSFVQGKLLKDNGVEAVLSSPKPTCVALYLLQNKEKAHNKKNKVEELNNYNKEKDGKPASRLRGWKMYWHHEVDYPPACNDNKGVRSRLFPLAHAAKSEIVIHVDRLTDLELGALLEAIHLPKDHAHKLGMGKPLGYGSIRLDIDWEKTDIKDMRDLHKNLAERLAGNTRTFGQAQMEEYKELFRKEILEKIKRSFPAWKYCKDFNDLPPIKALRIMMNYARKPDADAVAYMPLNKKDGWPNYAANGILPPPEVVNPKAANPGQ